MSTSSSSSTLQNLIGDFYSRRLLLIHSATVYQPPSAAAAPPSASNVPIAATNSFDANVVMVLSVLLCALICSLGLNAIVRCAMRCSALVSSRPGGSARLADPGVKPKALRAFATVIYSPELSLPGLDTECVICLSEFCAGERVRLLPKCHHGFHVRCIDKWLRSHSSCPTCRDCLVETSQKIVGTTAGSCGRPSELSAAVPVASRPEDHVVNIIAPVEPEGLIRNYRGIS